MEKERFICSYTPGIDAKAISQLLGMSLYAASIRYGEEVEQRDGRYHLDTKKRTLEVDVSTGFGKFTAHMFRVMIAQLFVQGEYTEKSSLVLERESRSQLRKR